MTDKGVVMEMMGRDAVMSALGAVEGWRLEGDALRRQFRFTDFAASMRFVNGAAAVAEELDHHPDMDIRYNRVMCRLTIYGLA